MGNKIDRPGQFRGTIIDYGLDKAKETRSTFVRLHCKIEEWWNGEAWEDWRSWDFEAYGSICIIKKDGTLNERMVDNLMSFAGWNSDFTAITQKTWEPTPIRFSVKEDSYKDKNGQEQHGFKVDWIDDYDSVPTGGNMQGNVAIDDAKTLNAQFGGSLRARRSNAARNAPKPASNGSKPAAPTNRRAAANAAATRLQAPLDDPSEARADDDVPPWEQDDVKQ
jgi:hypothetical protein